MKKICTFTLIICLFQLSVFIPNKSIWAVENADETNDTGDIIDFYDVNDENDNNESVGYSNSGVDHDYIEADTPSKIYSSNIYQYDNFMESYFDNLTTNHGDNTIGSCGYVAIDMLLCYYDTYLNDNIVPEQYDVPSESSCYNMICRRNSPGSMFDMPKGYSESNYIDADGNVDELQRNIDYYNYIEKMEGVSLHAKLLSLGNSLFGIKLLNLTPGLNHMGIKQIIHKYMADVLGFSNGDEYEIRDINHSLNANKSDEVRDFVIDEVQLGNPVLVGLDDGEGGGHWVIAYDYDEITDKIYCNFGWGGDATHITPENCVEELKQDPEKDNNYYIYESALTIEFHLPHVHSDNYAVTKIVDGGVVTNYYCYDSEEIEVYQNLPTVISYPSTHKFEFECGDSEYFVHSFNHLNYDDEQHTSTCLVCGYSVKNWHYLECSVDNGTHLGICGDCDAIIINGSSLMFISVSNSAHSVSCADCGYTETKPHTFRYTSKNATQHTKICTDCGTSITENHNYEGKIIDAIEHSLECDCGATNGTQGHIWTSYGIGKVKCILCEFKRILAPGEVIGVIKGIKPNDEAETE